MDAFQGRLAAARRGDPEALGAFTETLRTYLLFVANDRMGRDLKQKVGASDLVQETLRAVCRDLPSFRGNTPEEMRDWILRILANQLANIRRHYKTAKRDVGREEPLGEVEVVSGTVFAKDPASLAIEHEIDRTVQAAWEELPESDQRLLGFRLLERSTFEEIGRRLETTPEAARKRFVRIRERLRGRLASTLGDD